MRDHSLHCTRCGFLLTGTYGPFCLHRKEHIPILFLKTCPSVSNMHTIPDGQLQDRNQGMVA